MIVFNGLRCALLQLLIISIILRPQCFINQTNFKSHEKHIVFSQKEEFHIQTIPNQLSIGFNYNNFFCATISARSFIL